MKDKETRKRKYSLWLDESDSDSGKDSLLEDSDIYTGSSAESSKEAMPQDKLASSRFSTKSSGKRKRRNVANYRKCGHNPNF